MSAIRPIRVVIAAEQVTLRRDLRTSLAYERGVDILGEADSKPGALDLIRQLDPDIVLLNLEICRAFETSLLSRLATRIVVVIEKAHKAHIVDAFLCGAQAVVFRTVEPRVLFQSLRSVMAGHYWLEGEALGVLVEALRELPVRGNRGARSPKDYYGLTPRELVIIAKIASGCSNKDVSQEFSISERTVKHHLTNIFDKVGVSSRLELALFAVNHHLTEDEPTSLDLGKASAFSSS